MKQKIVHIIDNLRVGGAEKQLVLFCLNIDAQRFNQTVVCMREGGPLEAQLRVANIPIIILEKKSKIDVFFFVRLVCTLKKLQPDIIHCWLFSANFWGRIAALFLPYTKVIATERVNGDWKRWYHRLVDRMLLDVRTDILLANSSGVIQYCVEKEHLSLKKVRLVFNAIAVRERVRGPLPGRKIKKIVTISRLTHQKGVDCFIDVAEHVLARYPHVQFCIYGEGESEQVYKNMVRGRNLQDKIWFMGKDRIFNIMRDVDLFLSTSRYEGLPNAIMEAMAYGVPIVATDIGGTNELIVDGETGLLARKDDVQGLAAQVIKILISPEYGEQLGVQAKAFVDRRFLITHIVKELENVYDELLNGAQKNKNTVIFANQAVQRVEAKMFRLIHPELFQGIEKAWLERDLDMLKARCPGRVVHACDIGAGTGRLTHELLKRGCAVFAVELSRDMSDILRQEVAVGVPLQVVNDDIDTFLLKNTRRFDIICVSAMLHHLDDYQGVVGKLAQHLMDKGAIFISHEPVLRSRHTKRVLSFFIDKCDSVLFRLWLFFIKGKRLPVIDYSEADPHGRTGIDEERICAILEEGGCRIVSFERYAPRKTRLMRVIDQTICKTGHQFRIIAQKHN